jgi:NAD(P)-dependent dehydrogenase (short-subunit alcohol dehydrogenase family)
MRVTHENRVSVPHSLHSGIGLHAAKLFAVMNPMNRIILVARDSEKAKRAREEVLSVLPENRSSSNNSNTNYSENIIAMTCDHSRLASVRLFASELRRTLHESYHAADKCWTFHGIDVLCLNAAILQPENSAPEYTEDELEVTFQTNYLAPFLIANLTKDLVNPISGRIILTTSGLHCMIQLSLDGVVIEDDTAAAANKRGPVVRKPFDMIDGSEFHFKRSYALSKLCIVAFCAELHQRLLCASSHNNNNNSGIRVNSFSPGLMTSSGMFRHQPNVAPGDGAAPHGHINKNAFLNEKSVEWGAGALVYMCIADEAGKRGCEYWSDAHSSLGSMAKYGSDFCPTRISDQVVDGETRRRLWNVSCQLAELKEQDG